MYLSIDIGGTFVKYGYYDEEGNCYNHGKIKTVKTNIQDFYLSLLSLKQSPIKAIAVSMPGLLDSDSGYVHAITLLPFLANRNVKKDLEELFQLPVTIENDAKCAAMGEMWKGSLKNVCNGLFIIFGSGIGGTIILDGKIIKTTHHKAGEIGSILMPLDDNYQHMTNFGANNNANKLIHTISQKINCTQDGQTVFKQIDSPEAKEVLSLFCRQIAFMIYNLDYVLDLDVICIGGGISEQTAFIDTINDEFIKLRNQYKEDNHQPIITSCTHHNNTNLLGALYHLLNKKSS